MRLLADMLARLGRRPPQHVGHARLPPGPRRFPGRNDVRWKPEREQLLGILQAWAPTWNEFRPMTQVRTRNPLFRNLGRLILLGGIDGGFSLRAHGSASC